MIKQISALLFKLSDKMIKSLFLILFSSLSFYAFAQSDLKSLLKELDQTIQNNKLYMDRKERKIDQLKARLISQSHRIADVYEINKALCDEYRSYKTDSAVRYVEHNMRIADSTGNADMITESKLQRVSLYAISGMYLEAEKMLESISSKTLDHRLKIDYYQLGKDLYNNISTYNRSLAGKYEHLSGLYRDSLLNILDKQSKRYQAIYAEKLALVGRFSEARQILLKQLESITPRSHEHAMVTSAIGNVYRFEGDTEKECMYFALSAISDIENAVKENTSLQALAIALYQSGDLDHAYSYIKYSMDDAIFCNAPLRTLIISKMFPIIDAAHQAKINKQREQLWFYLIVISVLSVCLIIAVIYVLRQMKKLQEGRIEISKANELLEKLNFDLKVVNEKVIGINRKLVETNLIKEEYIGNFLDLCSDYINKLEDYRKTLHKTASSGKMEELLKMLRSGRLVDEELKQLYKNFDNIFLHLYPDFVEEFNKLLVDGEQFLIKPGELNTELRIFALIRLGIYDTGKIANFLRCSMSTVYNYRTKIRNKAAVPRGEFDQFVLEIGTFANTY
ncbi:DUF6377 domain-containing protein [Sphingobacterium siyangense]|uniref:DUF6377 domain-containing protein n=1 Tax=Sphingobacterium siyangense TaxID=459529 RepID=UPI003DA1CAA0